MVFHKCIWSHKSDEWITPTYIYQKLDSEFHFKLDPCTISSNPLNTSVFYTKEDNGLEKPWINPTFVNPPYGGGMQHVKWIDKAIKETKNGVTSVMLLPARVDTKWFHEYLYDKNGIEIRFVNGRLKFRIPTTLEESDSAPFPSMLVIFHSVHDPRVNT